MRIISGIYKGIIIKGFTMDGTRPTMDRIKESLFAMIQNYLKSSVCLDLFAGSGNLGIEAISNGASKCIFSDINKEAIKTIKGNLESLKIVDYELYHGNYLETLKILKNKKFDIIFLDPPYNLNLINECLIKIKEYDLLNNEGIIICEYENELINPPYNIYKEKTYGTKKITILRNN